MTELGVRFELTWAKPAAYKTAPINRYGNPANGTLTGTRTPNTKIRNLVLYPIEL